MFSFLNKNFSFQNLDLRTHKLIYEGSLNWRIGNRQKLIDIHVLLLHDVIILLQKQDEKYVLKFYNVNNPSGGAPTLSPIVKVSSVLVRDNAVGEFSLNYVMQNFGFHYVFLSMLYKYKIYIYMNIYIYYIEFII